MKYIRTKNGIYEVVEDNNKEWGKQIVVKFPKNLNMKLADVKDQILKQANTIEELCDELVDEELHYIIKNKEIIKDIPNNPELKNHKIYGAIWTDKGLIYVAKMNSKGELELI